MNETIIVMSDRKFKEIYQHTNITEKQKEQIVNSGLFDDKDEEVK